MTIDENGIVIYSKEEVEVLYQRERDKQLALTPEVKELREILKILNKINERMEICLRMQK